MPRSDRGGDRRALARAITLVESTRDDHAEQAAELLATVLPDTGGAVRVGISGRTVSPPLYESMELLGRERSLSRLTAARARTEQPSAG